jgi:polysaccharide deacetylase family protein (PEP-CTERM system associated)
MRRIVEAGHELASHGYDHTRVTNLDPARFREDVIRTKKTLEDITGVAISGYRAPTFSIDVSTPWALSTLRETGHLYSSSVYPVNHDLYGFVDGRRFPYREENSGLLEIPISTVEVMGHNLPCGGGGYFRLYPYVLTRWCYRRINRRDARAGVFYMHPWEIDAEQPRVDGLKAKARFRHYLNLKNTEKRLRRLLTDFQWGRMDEIFLNGVS